VSSYKTKLSSLDSYMALCDSNIDNFNKRVKVCIMSFEAGGVNVDSLMQDTNWWLKGNGRETYKQPYRLKVTGISKDNEPHQCLSCFCDHI